jgi:photosystem II stability/assembly factor-like uncharacterized protein
VAAEKAKAEKAKAAAPEEKVGGMNAATWSGLAFRSIGPATTGGRIADLAVDPRDPATYYAAVASGGVWKTTNAGTTWTPVFDQEGSYSIGVVRLDPRNPAVVWVGTGENNSQRSVGYGDGVYKSEDGGKSWQNMGLKASEHVGEIVIDPRDSSVVYVAAQGPLWAPGGDRGVYKTTDGGKTWEHVLKVSEHTGASDLVMAPDDPDTLYASAYQRRRHVFTLIDGGPESAIYKTTDAGRTWKKLASGLPKEDLGRIGLAVPPTAPHVVYAVVEAANKAGGFFRSTDRGATWEKRSDYVPDGPQYYNQIFADPKDPERVYSMDVFLQVTDDGGKTFRDLGEKNKHVDNHVMWVNPADTDHYRVGCDGGIYESFDRGASWTFFDNMPLTQFYRVAVDEGVPYRVYGGTQDNNTVGGPSRTFSDHGITNVHWEVFRSGDGFQPRVDPRDPDTVYAQAQYGGLDRVDRRTGENTPIQPQEDEGEAALRWNWDSPLLISPHSPTRLYFAAQRVFRSDDRGDTWKAVSPDLTRQIDRNRLPVMGRVWPADAVAKNASTSFYGNIVSFSESPKVEGLLYAGTDDGLVQVSEDGGANWRRIERLPGVPERSYVSRLEASQHDADVVYAAFDNHKEGDFKPYVLRSADRGRTWTSIAADLPARGTVYALAEDHVNPRLLFAGTEFGLFFTSDGGGAWVRLKGGLPTIAVRDIAVQKRENDLVLATFGRGFYVLDDYRPLRLLDGAALQREAALLPVRDAWMFHPATELGFRGKGFMGDSFYAASNPPFGAVFTYYLHEPLLSRRKARQAREKEADKKGEVPPYPTPAELRAEADEVEPAVVLTVTDAEGQVVRRLTGPVEAGFSRVAWDLRFPPAEPTRLQGPTRDIPWNDPPRGPMVVPGTYRVSLARRVDGVLTPLGEPQTFAARAVRSSPLSASDRGELDAFLRKTARLQRAAMGAAAAAEQAQERLRFVEKALLDTPSAPAELAAEAHALAARLRAVRRALEGDEVLRRRNEPQPPAILDRVQTIVGTQWTSSAAPTTTSRRGYDIAARAFATQLAALRTLLDQDLRRLEERMETAGAPWTPGRLPVWAPE